MYNLYIGNCIFNTYKFNLFFTFFSVFCSKFLIKLQQPYEHFQKIFLLFEIINFFNFIYYKRNLHSVYTHNHTINKLDENLY